MRGERHNRDAADFLQRKVQVGEFDDVGELHDYAIEWPQPFVEKVERQLLRSLVELAVSDDLVAVDDRHAIGVFGEYGFESIPEGSIFPVSLLTVPSRELWWKPDDSVKHPVLASLGISNRKSQIAKSEI